MVHTIQGKEIGDIGLGLIGFTRRFNPVPREQSLETLKAAVELGCTYWNAAPFYGTPDDNSMTLLREYFDRYPEDAAKVLINVKGCCAIPGFRLDSSAEGVRTSVEACLAQLNDSGGGAGAGAGAGAGVRIVIDQFGPARKDPKVEIEDTVRSIEQMVRDGGDQQQVRGITLSEVSAETIRRAAKVVKVEAVEVEISLWQTEALTNGVCQACAELGIPVLAYAPLCRGALTGKVRSFDDLQEGDVRRILPRFQPDVFHLNLKLVDEVEALAKKKGCTAAQIAINWLLALSKKPGMPTIIPIPGCTTIERLRENLTSITLTEEDLATIDRILAEVPVLGDQYHKHGMEMLDKSS